ncbi:hypothetical protein BACPEC_00484 [[Bacteroides] pectinophilus ATCC 43243]|uniref:Uncharacterized protein n=1 Tax=[Bacteroides] pectinophilus ATCC 43243 TaxID=483218 RepID=B7AP80_9FIRM|nr:hypothetical protein BACPEC_00484 [[Bacteroides] pectinophilus ATCC 43243]
MYIYWQDGNNLHMNMNHSYGGYFMKNYIFKNIYIKVRILRLQRLCWLLCVLCALRR